MKSVLLRGLVTLAVIASAGSPSQAQSTTPASAIPVGLLPFDTAGVEGRAASTGQNVAKIVRLEMIKGQQLQPHLLELPPGQRFPIEAAKAAELGKEGNVPIVVVGTVLEATVKRSSNRASSAVLGRVAGNMTRTSAEVSLHIQLVESAGGRVIDTFEVKASNTDTGVAADFSTAIGSFGTSDSSWQDSPMGKAIREAAQKLTAEVARRAGKARLN